MKKSKKFIYPIIFSAIFLILYISLVILLFKVISFPRGSYAPAAWAIMFALTWVIIAIPVYCIIYRKIIIEEKFKFLFSVYNSAVIILLHILPFNWQGEMIFIALFALYVLFWNIGTLAWKLFCIKYPEKTSDDEYSNIFSLQRGELALNWDDSEYRRREEEEEERRREEEEEERRREEEEEEEEEEDW